MNKSSESPFYLKFSLTLLGLALIGLALYLGKSILVPLFFAILLAIMLVPVTEFLQRHRFNKVLAILLTLFCALTIIGAIIYFLSSQIGSFIADIPTLEKRLNTLAASVQQWIQEHLNIAIRKQNQYVNETAEKMTNGGPDIVKQTVVTIKNLASYLVFLPVYTFLILYHKGMIKRFLIEIFEQNKRGTVTDVLHESQSITHQYVTGLLIELSIVFTLNSTGFFIAGIKYPIFLALVAALLNVIPYIGMIIANIFCILITLVSSENIPDIFLVFGVLAGVQIIDNNILMPLIVGTKVRLNALAIITGVLTGGILCGVPGMFLAIPGLAIMKVVFERVEDFKPWAILLGDETTMELEEKNPVKRKFSSIRQKSKRNFLRSRKPKQEKED